LGGVMKNVQVIDGAENCTYSIFEFTEPQFKLICPADGQDISFIDDVCQRLSEAEQEIAFAGVWDRPVDKHAIVGLHGTLFYQFEDRKSRFPKSGRECDWDERSINEAQRKLFARIRASSNR
jgi:hypothetical protein